MEKWPPEFDLRNWRETVRAVELDTGSTAMSDSGFPVLDEAKVYYLLSAGRGALVDNWMTWRRVDAAFVMPPRLIVSYVEGGKTAFEVPGFDGVLALVERDERIAAPGGRVIWSYGLMAGGIDV